MRILFLASWYPYPPNNGSKLRIYNLLRGLAQKHEVQLITLSAQAAVIQRAPELDAICKQVQILPQRPYNPASRRAILGLLSPTPRSIVDIYVPGTAEQIRQEVQSKSYDLVIASEWATAAYWRSFCQIPSVFEDLELGIFEAKKAEARTPLHRLRHQFTLLKLNAYLQRTLPRFGVCTVVSQIEKRLLRQSVPGYNSVEVIPNCVSVDEYRSIQGHLQPNTLIFSGSFTYFVNYEAMVWFVEKSYPLIQAQVPNVQLMITGNHANMSLPAARNVTLTGFVDDVRPLIASAAISLAPIRLGGGTRLKILEAMALRTPVVATSKGAEGLDVQHDTHLLIADTPEAYAQAVIRLLKEPDLRQRLVNNAYQLVCEKYDWSVVMPHFLTLVEGVAHGEVQTANPVIA